MERYNVNVEIKNKPILDPEFTPLLKYNQAFLAGAKKPISIAVERADKQMATTHTYIHGTPEMAAADNYYIDRLVKTLLWMKGGFRVYVTDQEVYDYLNSVYCQGGAREFDYDFMSNIFDSPFEVILTEQVPEAMDLPKPIGGHLDGCRIGFDAGGSDRKVSAVIDGETVYSEEVLWLPKVTPDPQYHYDGIVAAMKTAAEHMPRVDAIGVSSAGVFINDRAMTASLFLSVPTEIQRSDVVRDIYIRAIKENFGDVPYAVANDGDVSALAGAMSLNDNNILGIAMGTSEAVGYIDGNGNVTGWLNELAFCPVDANPDAMEDEWSGDIGTGCKYFSQDAVIKLAPRAGIELDEDATPAQKLKAVQQLMEADDPRAAQVFFDIGVYLGHTLAYYYDNYGFKYVLLLGRVMSGKGGDLLLETCKKVLEDEYPAVDAAIRLTLPDEKFRRVGQSMAAASLAASK